MVPFLGNQPQKVIFLNASLIPFLMLSGSRIADRIELLMRETPHTSKTAVGELLTTKKDSSPRAKRKHYAALIRHLREEKIIAELRIVAEYLDVSVGFLVFGGQFFLNPDCTVRNF